MRTSKDWNSGKSGKPGVVMTAAAQVAMVWLAVSIVVAMVLARWMSRAAGRRS